MTEAPKGFPALDARTLTQNRPRPDPLACVFARVALTRAQNGGDASAELAGGHCRTIFRIRNWGSRIETIAETKPVLDEHPVGPSARRPHWGRGRNRQSSA